MNSFRRRSFKERAFEVIPGAMFWGTLFFALFFSRNHPAWVAAFIILFDLYWLFKAINGAAHLISAYRRYRLFAKYDWVDFIRKLEHFPKFLDFLRETIAASRNAYQNDYLEHEIKRISKLVENGCQGKNYRDYYQLVLYPFVNEGEEILNATLSALSEVNYPRDRIIVVLASEERAGEQAAKTAEAIRQKFAPKFFKFFVTVHPDGLEGEIRGKSANASYAVQSILPELQKLGIGIDSVIVSNFDSDTITHPQYFARVTYEFLTSENPYRRSYQPIAVYNNNIWDSPAFVRVVSVSNSFWQFIESSRPNRLRTFSSHSMTLRALVDIGFWRKDLINEDGYVFWQCYLHYQGDYQVVPLFISISLDTCLAESYFQTLVNQYKQKRRWAYNVEYYPSLIPALIKLKAGFFDRAYKMFQFVEGNYNWATASIVIAALGWLPLVLGGSSFGNTLIAANLPFMTKLLMTLATVILIFSVYINIILLPPRPAKYGKWRVATMYLQWFFVPIISVIFGALPAVDAQTRLMFGRYMEFWVTPKVRKKKVLQSNLELNLS